MSTDDTPIEETLKKWYDAKEKLKILEDRVDRYKKAVSKEMDRRSTDKLVIGNFSVSRRKNTRTSLSKDNVPKGIWEEYATRSYYDAFFLVKK